MTDTPLTRRQVTAYRGMRRKHRHKVTVSTEIVIECIGTMPDRWTTRDVAQALNVSERAVRAAVQWLSDSDLVRVVEEQERKTKFSNKPYLSRVYEIKPEPGICDVMLLNQIFMLRPA